MPTIGNMLEHLRQRFDTDKCILLRCPGSNGFIEVTKEQALSAVDELEKLCILAELGEKASPLQRIGIEMLLGWDFDYFAKKEEDASDL